jgi:hypothetical protein
MRFAWVVVLVACSPSSSGYPPYSPAGGGSADAATKLDGSVGHDAGSGSGSGGGSGSAVEPGFTCLSCEPSTQGSGSGCVETIGLVITCTDYTLPTGTQRVTLTDAHGSDSTSLATVSCGTTYQTYNLAVGSSGTCTDADIVHVSKIETTDTPPLEVTCAYNATTCGSGSN